jgi:hypothetical protein
MDVSLYRVPVQPCDLIILCSSGSREFFIISWQSSSNSFMYMRSFSILSIFDVRKLITISSDVPSSSSISLFVLRKDDMNLREGSEPFDFPESILPFLLKEALKVGL